MVTDTAIIKNDLGIHVRPSGLIITETAQYPGQIILKAKGLEMELKSIMDLLALGLEKGDKLEVSVTGPDEKAYCLKLIDLFECNFDFPPR